MTQLAPEIVLRKSQQQGICVKKQPRNL